jgi:hypothetical protein
MGRRVKNSQFEYMSCRIGKLILLVSLFTMALFTTGCKSDGAGILGKQSISSDTEDPLLKNAPFAYDYAADTISYNSCVIGGTSTADPVGLHGLKIGSSEGFADNLGTGDVKAGVKLRTAFLKYVGDNFSPDYPSNVIPPAQVNRILSTSYSIQNSNAFLQFAIRKKSDYTVIPDLISPPAPMTATPGRDAVVFPQNLSTGYLGYSITKNILYNINGSILAEGPRVYNLSDTQDSIPIEASLNLNATADETSNVAAVIATEPFGVAELYSQKVRDSFNTGTQLLTATFGGTGATSGVLADDAAGDTINNIKRPYKPNTTEIDTTKAFGRGYQLKFESQTTVTTWPKNRLTGVREIDLELGTPVGGASWSCEQFPIAPPSHWNNTRTSNKFWVKDSANTSALLAQVEPNCAPLLADDTNCKLPLVATLTPSSNDTAASCAVKTDRANQIKRIRRHYPVDSWNIGLMFVAKLKSGYSVPNFKTRIYDGSTGQRVELCVSPKSSSSCYLPTVGILKSGEATPGAGDALLDVGIQYERTEDCYMTTAPLSGTRDPERKKGRCAQYASVCIRN